MNKNLSNLLVSIVLLAIVLGLSVHYLARPSEIEILKESISDVKRFYETHVSVLNSLVEIPKNHKDEQEYWSVGWNLEKKLDVVGLSTNKWDEVILFSPEEKKIIETAFSVSYRDISIRHFDSHGRIWVKVLNRYYIEIMFLPDEELRHYWIHDDSLVKYSEPISDSWYLLIIDGRPAFA